VKVYRGLTGKSTGAGRPRLGRFVRGMATVAVVLPLLVSAPARVGSLPPGAVEIRDSKYAPEDLVIAPGSTVRWVNQDEETHTVTSTTEAFKSGGLNLGDEYTHTFTAPGLYPYTCALHEFMHGTIVVK
jgi:plastocyanin